MISLLHQIGTLLLEALNWLFSASSAGILTISTGFIAWLVYRSQVKAREREAAIVLLNEIRHAEGTLNKIRSSGFDVQNETISILPTYGWERNYQIFARYIDRDEFNLINEFFTKCKAAQSELEQWRQYCVVAREEKAREIQRKLIALADRNCTGSTNDNKEQYKEKYEKEKACLLQFAKDEDSLFSFGKPEIYFRKYVETLPQVSGTTAMASLRTIAKER